MRTMNLTGKPILELAEGSEADEAEEADDVVRGADLVCLRRRFLRKRPAREMAAEPAE